MGGLEVEDGGAAEEGLEHGDKEADFDGAVVAEVEDAAGGHRGFGGRVEQGFDGAGDDVVDVGEVALGFAGAEELDGLAGGDGLGEEGGGGVGAAPGAVNVEEAQAGEVEAVKVGVAVGHHFVGLFGGAVEGEGVAGIVVFGEGGRGAGAVNAAGGGEDGMFGRVGAGGFEEVKEADEVALHVGAGVIDAVAHVGLGAEVDDVVGLKVGPEAEEFSGVGKVELDEAEAVGVGGGGEVGEAVAFEGNGVVGVEVVDAEHVAVPSGEEAAGDMVTDEPGGAGDEDLHAGVE